MPTCSVVALKFLPKVGKILKMQRKILFFHNQKNIKHEIAAIDIRSNAARLLINEVKEPKKKPEFVKLNLLRIPFRLGIDVFTTGEIGKERKNGH